jgi:hypothetical protein
MWQGADAVAAGRVILIRYLRRRRVLHGWMDGWDWVWMSFMIVFWLIVLGPVVYAAVRLAEHGGTRTTSACSG